ncbi:MAG: glycosyltransferase family 4 protein [Melioribacteraceae bacterium]|nr:glycosyltransferase family 4 protein [Melioribacteraceae bacterium]MCF8263431.1 glycosyltransferase family 4 protein [Melioribacteraceae bacterium]MCF8430429.1 glycosyltransferase family 4 protein [Melioribacteraceae bacterium]
MKIVHVNNFEVSGGAARAMQNIHASLRLLGVDSKILAQYKTSDDNNAFGLNSSRFDKIKSDLRSNADTIQRLLLARPEKGKFSFGSLGTDIANHDEIKSADVVHLHWINNGFLSLRSLNQLFKSKKIIVWTLHDMWAFTGGCHYSDGCENFFMHCGNCPYLKLNGKSDKSFQQHFTKTEIYDKATLQIVTCSNWLGGLAKQSTLLSGKGVSVIPNPINMATYSNVEKRKAKGKLSLDSNKIHMLFGTWSLKDKRKGFFLLNEAIHLLKKKNISGEIELLFFGRVDESKLDLPFPYKSFGRLSNENEIANLYSAADFSVVPSLEDNLPNTVMESLSCGTPVLAFNIGGIPDMVDHKKNGYLVNDLNSEALENGLEWFINNKKEWDELSKNARLKVENNFSFEKIGKAYKELYTKLIN